MARSTSRAELQKAVDEIEKCGGVKAEAAKNLGLPISTLKNRWYAAVRNGIKPSAVAGKQKVSTGVIQAELVQVKGKLQHSETEGKAKDRTIKQLEERLERVNKSKWKLPTATKPRRGGTFVRVIMPDTHGAKVDTKAIAAFLGDLQLLAPKEIVLLGDHLDCGGFLAQHHVLGYVAETTHTFEDDISAANQLLDKLQAICPVANFHYLEGNHEQRLEKWCVTQSLRNTIDAKFLLKQFGTEAVLHLEKRGIPIYKQGVHYQDLPLPATIKLGHCYFTHGSRTGMASARNMLQDFAGNVVFGHIHQIAFWSARTVDNGAIMAASPGCLCTLQPKWMHTQLTRWQHGYGVQLVNPDGTFLHINVPIIDGKSYLIALADRLG